MGLKASRYELKKIECCNTCSNRLEQFLVPFEEWRSPKQLKYINSYCTEHGCHVDWNGICDEYEWRKG